ncbi:hypothetical protein JCM10213_003775 [Rhodosporidiobolus nylandii]
MDTINPTLNHLHSSSTLTRHLLLLHKLPTLLLLLRSSLTPATSTSNRTLTHHPHNILTPPPPQAQHPPPPTAYHRPSPVPAVPVHPPSAPPAYSRPSPAARAAQPPPPAHPRQEQQSKMQTASRRVPPPPPPPPAADSALVDLPAQKAELAAEPPAPFSLPASLPPAVPAAATQTSALAVLPPSAPSSAAAAPFLAHPIPVYPPVSGDPLPLPADLKAALPAIEQARSPSASPVLVLGPSVAQNTPQMGGAATLFREASDGESLTDEVGEGEKEDGEMAEEEQAESARPTEQQQPLQLKPSKDEQDGFISLPLSAPGSAVSASTHDDEVAASSSESEDESDAEVASSLVPPTVPPTASSAGGASGAAGAAQRKGSILGLATGEAGEDSAMEDVSLVETAASDDDDDEEEDGEAEKELDEEEEADISDLEGAVHPHLDGDEEEDGEEHDVLPFDLGSGSELDGEDHDDEEDNGAGDESADISFAASGRRAKRRRLDRRVSSLGGLGVGADGETDAEDAGSRTTSRAASVDLEALAQAHPERPTKPLPHRKSALQRSEVSERQTQQDQQEQPAHDLLPETASSLAPDLPSTSTLTLAAPADSDAALQAILSELLPSALPQQPATDPRNAVAGDADEDEQEEGELLEEGEVQDFGAPSGQSHLASSLATPLAGLNDGPPFSTTSSAPASAAGSFASIKPDGVPGQAQITTPLGGQQVAVLASPISARASPAPSGGKASYQRRQPPPPGVVVPAQASLAHADPSALPSPSLSAASAGAAFPALAPAKGVYVRRQPTLPDGTATPAPAQPAVHKAPLPPQSAVAAAAVASGAGKAVYERSAAAEAAAASTAAKQSKKAAKAAAQPKKKDGVLPLTLEERAERLPIKFYASFPEFDSPAAAADPSIFAPPPHSILPGKNLPPPNESCTHGFWPAPPALKAGKAVFPAPPTPLPDAPEDLRPRVDVFIDNSNVLYSFLNWVRARPDAKITSKVQTQKGGKSKTIKTVTLGGKKVKMDYRALFALLERGRKIERRVLVGSSTLWQTLEPAVDWGYEISLLQRVPRAEPVAPSSASVQPAPPPPPPPPSKKRGKNGKLKQQKQQTQAQPQAAAVKHYKEQAVDELVHLKILESLLDYTPPPLPLVELPPPPAPVEAADTPVEPAVVEGDATAASSETDQPAAEPVQEEKAVHFASMGEERSDTPAGEQSTAGEEGEAMQTDEPEVSASLETDERELKEVEPPAEEQQPPAADVEEDDEFEAVDALAPTKEGEEADLEPSAIAEDAVMRGELAKEDGIETEAQGEEEAAAPLPDAVADAAMHEETQGDSEKADEPAPSVDQPVATAPASPAPATPVSLPVPAAKPRFMPSAAYTSGKVSTPSDATASPQPKFVPAAEVAKTASKFTPAVPKITAAVPKITPAPPPPPLLSNPKDMPIVPRSAARDRPTLVVATGDANSSEYNPGGFLGCVRRALDRGWDVEVVAFTHGLSSHWAGEQMKRVTDEGRERGELRVVNLGLFAEELCA